MDTKPSGSVTSQRLSVRASGRLAESNRLLQVTRWIHFSRSNTTFWKARTAVQVWTIEEGFGIGSEFRQTCCAARNFRGHEILFRCFNSSSPKWNYSRSTDTLASPRRCRAGGQASVPLIRYRLTSPGEDSPDKERFQLAGDRRRQFRFQEIKHHDNRLLGVLLADPCFLYDYVC